jgi:hypothetical protein
VLNFTQADPPALEGGPAEKPLFCADVFRMLDRHIGIFCSLLFRALDKLTLQNRLDEIGKTRD